MHNILEVDVHTYAGIVFCDVDGTILPHGERTVSSEFFALVEEARQADFLICISSGRFHEALLPLFSPVSSKVVFSASNGCRVLYQGRELFPDHGIEYSMAEQITSSLHAWGATALVSTTEAIYLPTIAREQLKAKSYLAKGYTRFFDTFSEISGDVMQITAVCEGNLPAILAKSRKVWGSAFHVVTTGKEMFDICPTSKGISLRAISEHFSVPIAHTYAFGDDENDIPMLEAAGKGYIMGNAHQGVKGREFEHCHDLIGTIREILAKQIVEC
jgi:hypothetical protein